MFWFSPFLKKKKNCSTRKLLTDIYIRLNCHKNNALWHYWLPLKVRMRDISYCLIYIFKEVCRSIYFWDLPNLTGEASIFRNALCRYFCTISKGICDTSGEDWQVDEITMWLLKSACMSAVSSCDGNNCIAWPSFSIICLGFTVLFSRYHNGKEMFQGYLH